MFSIGTWCKNVKIRMSCPGHSYDVTELSTIGFKQCFMWVINVLCRHITFHVSMFDINTSMFNIST